MLAAGAVTGVTETATGIGGPPLALVYQHMISLALLAATGKVSSHQIEVALLLVPALVLGALLSGAIHHRVDGPLMRSLVLGFALISGVVLILQG